VQFLESLPAANALLHSPCGACKHHFMWALPHPPCGACKRYFMWALLHSPCGACKRCGTWALLPAGQAHHPGQPADAVVQGERHPSAAGVL